MTRQEHLLTIAMEECNEVAQRLSKALRFGMEEAQPIDTGGDGTTNNRDRIWNEWCDLVALMRMLTIPCASIAAMEAKREKVERFLAYSAKCGTLAASLEEETPAPAYTIEVEHEEDGRWFASWTTGDKREGGCAPYSTTLVGALAELCSTLLKVAEDKSVEATVALVERTPGETS